MKKTFILTIILLIFLMVPQYTYADTYSFNDGGIDIELDRHLAAYTENSDVSDIKGAPEKFNLLVHNGDLGYYWYFYFITNKDSMDFASLSDEKIMELVESDSGDIETNDVNHEIYNTGGYKYLVIDSFNDETKQYIHYYVTGVGNALYYFIAPSSDNELKDAQKADMKKVIDGIRYTKKEPPTKEDERRAAMLRIIKRFAICVVAIVIFVILREAFFKIKGSIKGNKQK